MNICTRKRGNKGFTLIEVLIGILIFALGMMALAKLQGNLARNSGDSNARTVATNIAEEIIESARVFQKIDSGGGLAAYNDIVDATETITRAGNVFTVVTDVTDYYYDAVEDEFTTEVPSSAGKSDFKRIDLTVTWNSGQEFQVDAVTTTNGRLGSGSIRISDAISSIPSGSGGKASLGAAGDGSYAPPVNYTPGENPDIISIKLGETKFKESTTPLPDIIRQDEIVETKFDVVTYSQLNEDSTFLRREEFLAVTCECTLKGADPDNKNGRRPTVWEGTEYTEGEFVSKPYGVSVVNENAQSARQSPFCNICCRDHHDGGSGSLDNGDDPGRSRYNAFRTADGFYYDSEFGSLQGDHKHYKRGANGLVLAGVGDIYVEACRLVRKDGFFQVAQDLRQEELNSFPADFLDDPDDIAIYSNYVTAAIEAYEFDTDPSNSEQPTNPYEETPPELMAPANMVPSVVFPASTSGNRTVMSSRGLAEQQLRARGIYVDYMSDELRKKVNCVEKGFKDSVDFDPAGCGVPNVNSALEIIPFYDVQLTWLARWNEDPTNYPISVSNDPIANSNSHSRGLAKVTDGYDTTEISSFVHTGNLGLTGTDPIDPDYNIDEAEYVVHAIAVDYGTPPQPSGITISGTITSSVGFVDAALVKVDATGAQCDRTNTGYECVIDEGANNPRIRVYNYFREGKELFGCSSELQVHGTEHSGDNPVNNWTDFNLPDASSAAADIVIKLNGC